MVAFNQVASIALFTNINRIVEYFTILINLDTVTLAIQIIAEWAFNTSCFIKLPTKLFKRLNILVHYADTVAELKIQLAFDAISW